MDVSAPSTLTALFVRLLLAAALGAAVGINRELQQKPAGFRTHAMVALGAALMSLVAVGLSRGHEPLDTSSISRVLQGIIAGIGFVGAGVILRRDDAQGVHGVTTATSIWVVAAIGMATGLGMWAPAVAAVVLALFVLTVGEVADRALYRFHSDRARDDRR
jgi:putative Mg2+ transporter-C (MgtC) family protein